MTPAPDDLHLQHAYETRTALGGGPPVSEVERAQLAATFLEVGASAPTLSGDWNAHHLAAHLVLRESNPVGSVKAAVPSLGDDAVDDVVRRSPYFYLVEVFRTGPPTLSFFRLPGTDRHLNVIEHFIHHEDVRRAQTGWTRRDLPMWAEDQIWTPLKYFAKGITRNAPVALMLERSDTGEQSVARKGAQPVVVRGLPSELALYVYGRPQVADYALDGPAESVEKLDAKRFRF